MPTRPLSSSPHRTPFTPPQPLDTSPPRETSRRDALASHQQPTQRMANLSTPASRANGTQAALARSPIGGRSTGRAADPGLGTEQVNTGGPRPGEGALGGRSPRHRPQLQRTQNIRIQAGNLGEARPGGTGRNLYQAAQMPISGNVQQGPGSGSGMSPNVAILRSMRVHNEPSQPRSASAEAARAESHADFIPPPLSRRQAMTPDQLRAAWSGAADSHQTTRPRSSSVESDPTPGEAISGRSTPTGSPEFSSSRLGPPPLLRRQSSLPSELLRMLSDVKTNRAVPPEGLVSKTNNVDPTVPGFPNLYRGSAQNDGDCLLNSVIHLGGPTLASHLGVKPDALTADVVRQHVAAHLTSEFQLLNLGVSSGTTYEVLTALGDENAQPQSRDTLVKLLGPLRADQVLALKPAQQAHVVHVATPRQFGGIVAEMMPALLADAFPGLTLITHQANSTPETLAEHGTFVSRSEGGQPSAPATTVRVYLEREHYEPVFERQPGQL